MRRTTTLLLACSCLASGGAHAQDALDLEVSTPVDAADRSDAESEVVEIIDCSQVRCDVPALCEPACCGSCYDPCVGVDCSNPAGCSQVCCGTCPQCAEVDCNDYFECTITCCGACGTSCFDGVTCPATACTQSICDFERGCVPYSVDFTQCDDGDPTTGVGFCLAGECQPGKPIEVPPCTPGFPCDDLDPCTDGDVCDALGGCAGQPRDCDDNTPCTDDFCSPGNGLCGHTPRPERCPAALDQCREATCATIVGCGEQDRADGAGCDDGVGCTVSDTCFGGACQAGALTVCNDNDVCTGDLCVEPTGTCAHTPQTSCETCDEEVPVPAVELSLAEELDFTQKCPVLPGDLGVKLEAKATASASYSGCPQCKAEVAIAGEIKGELNLCDVTFGLEGGASYASTRQWCTTCGGPRCKKLCGDTSCEGEKYEGFAGLSVSKFYGWQGGWRYTPRTNVLPTLSIAAKCGVKITGKVKVSGAVEETEDKGCEPCTGCESEEGKVTLGLEGEGGCGIRLRAGRYKADFGCLECGKLSLEGSLGAKQKRGECGDETCLTASAKIYGGVKFPCFDAGWWWFTVKVECEAGIEGEISYDCEAQDPTVKLKAACTVARGGCE